MPFPPDAAEKIRTRLDQGILPRDAPAKMWVGFGTYRPCSACDEKIFPAQVEYEFVDASDGLNIRFHLGCAGLWEAERRRRGWAKPPEAPGATV